MHATAGENYSFELYSNILACRCNTKNKHLSLKDNKTFSYEKK